MRAALISMGSVSSKMIGEAMKKYFDEVDMLNIKSVEISFSGKTAEVLYEGEPLKDYDCIYAKGSFRFAPLLRSITSFLMHKCYMPIAPETFTTVHDKLLTQLELQKHEIPMPLTYMAATAEEAKKVLSKVNYPVIMKLPQGTHGKGVMFADSLTSATSLLDALSALKQSFIIQEFVDTQKDLSEGGSDIRAIVVGDRVVAAMRRKAKKDEVRSNIHMGGEGEPVSLSPLYKRLAVKVAKALKAEIIGVDMLESVKGPLVIEANVSPSVQGITKATRIDVADKIARHLYSRTKALRDLEKAKRHGSIMSELNSHNAGSQRFISNLDFRGIRILLPEVITRITGFEEHDNFEITASKGSLTIKKLNIK